MVITQPLPRPRSVALPAGTGHRRGRAPPSPPPSPRPDDGPALPCRLLPRHRQAAPSIQESLLTMSLLAQTSRASTGPNSLGLVPRAPSPALAPPSHSPLPLQEASQTTTAQSPCRTCQCRSPLPKQQPSSRSRNPESRTPSRSGYSRVTFTWTKYPRTPGVSWGNWSQAAPVAAIWGPRLDPTTS